MQAVRTTGQLQEQIKKESSGKTIVQGGALPDDNVRIYKTTRRIFFLGRRDGI